MSFLPAPESERCAAVTYHLTRGTFFTSRCPERHMAGSDLCALHREREADGLKLRRVKATKETA